MPSLPTTSDNYILLKYNTTQNVILLVGLDGGYFASDTETLYSMNSGDLMFFPSAYMSTFDGTKYDDWIITDATPRYNLSDSEIIYKSKPIYPISPHGYMYCTTLPEGVSWNDKIILSYSNETYNIYKPENNNGIWVDVNNENCNFVYRDTLTAKNQTLNRYTYNPATSTWISGTYERTEGFPNEVFYVGADVFSIDVALKREDQRSFYAQGYMSNDIPLEPFEPLEPAEAKDFLNFISNVSENKIEQILPEYYNLLTGAIQDPEEELKVKLSFITYVYYCLDLQLFQCSKKIDIGTTYLINWVGDNTETSTIIYDEIKDELLDNLKSTIAKNLDIPKMSIGVNIVTNILEYGELLVHSVGSILSIKKADDIRYLMAYLQFLKFEYNGNKAQAMLFETTCAEMPTHSTFYENPLELQKYAKYIFNLEHSISN